MNVEYRIVGGHMVTLLVAVSDPGSRLPVRETLDADFGALPEVIGDPRFVQAYEGNAPVESTARKPGC